MKWQDPAKVWEFPFKEAQAKAIYGFTQHYAIRSGVLRTAEPGQVARLTHRTKQGDFDLIRTTLIILVLPVVLSSIYATVAQTTLRGNQLDAFALGAGWDNGKELVDHYLVKGDPFEGVVVFWS